MRGIGFCWLLFGSLVQAEPLVIYDAGHRGVDRPL